VRKWSYTASSLIFLWWHLFPYSLSCMAILIQMYKRWANNWRILWPVLRSWKIWQPGIRGCHAVPSCPNISYTWKSCRCEITIGKLLFFFVCSWCSLALSYFCSPPPPIFGENNSSCLLKRQYSSAIGKCGSFHEVSCLRGIRMTSIF
jgi:hypothetical protein